jgi:hypothetical protein
MNMSIITVASIIVLKDISNCSAKSNNHVINADRAID